MAGGLAVVLSGGGAKGAFQVGVLDQLMNQFSIDFDLFVGVSTGSIQAAGGAMNDIAGLVKYWNDIQKDEDIYLKKFGSFFGKLRLLFFGVAAEAGLLGLESIYDASPLRAKLQAFVDDAKIRQSGRGLRIGVASLQTGNFKAVDETASSIADWVYASCAEPVLFEPVWRENGSGGKAQWVDGGVRNITPLGVAMDAKPRKILVIRASPPPGVDQVQKRLRSLLAIGLRTVDILSSEVSRNDIEQTELINGLVKSAGEIDARLQTLGLDAATRKAAMAPLTDIIANYRFVPVALIEPAVHFSKPHEFDPAKIQQAMAAGRQAVLSNWTTGSMLEEFLTT